MGDMQQKQTVMQNECMRHCENASVLMCMFWNRELKNVTEMREGVVLERESGGTTEEEEWGGKLTYFYEFHHGMFLASWESSQ